MDGGKKRADDCYLDQNLEQLIRQIDTQRKLQGNSSLLCLYRNSYADPRGDAFTDEDEKRTCQPMEEDNKVEGDAEESGQISRLLNVKT